MSASISSFGLLSVVVDGYSKEPAIMETKNHLLHLLGVRGRRAARAVSRPPRKFVDHGGAMMDHLQIGCSGASNR